MLTEHLLYICYCFCYDYSFLTHWLLERFGKMRFLDILVLFELDLSQISFNLVKNGLATKQLAFLATSIAFYHIVTLWVIDLLLGLLAVKKLLRKCHRDGQILAWSSQVKWQEILLSVFHSTFWAFLCISKALFGWSLWSGHHWKLSIDDANFGQKWWRWKWKRGQGSSRVVTDGTGVNGLIPY